MGIFGRFAKAYRVYHSETYRETIRSAETVAGASLRLFADQSAREQAQILERVTELSEKLHNAIDGEIPLVIALTLLTAIRAHEQVLKKHPDKFVADR